MILLFLSAVLVGPIILGGVIVITTTKIDEKLGAKWALPYMFITSAVGIVTVMLTLAWLT